VSADSARIAPVAARDDYYADLLAYPSSDLGIGDVVKFDHSTKMWHIWNGVRWEPDKTSRIIEMMRDCLYDWMDDNRRMGHEDANKTLMSLMDHNRKQTVLKTLAAKAGIAMTGEEWDLQHNLMGFNNGVLDLETLAFHDKPDPEWLITKSTGIDWDPNAMAPDFEQFLSDIMSGDTSLVDYVIKVLGYSAIGGNPEQKFWMWVGRGSNGKGILARTVTKALGDYASNPPDTLYMKSRMGAATSNTPRPDLLKLQGARFTYMSEPQAGGTNGPTGLQFNEALLKAHTGNDPIEARTLHSSQYKTFFPTHTIHFLTNDTPKTDDVGPSMQRRVRIIKFMEDYSPQSGRADFGLEAKLQTTENLQGVARLLAEAAGWYFRNGALPEPQPVLDWSQSYISENDPISDFIAAKCVESPAAEVRGGEFYKAYRQWAEESAASELNNNQFGHAMSSRFVRKSRAAGTFYLGVRLKNVSDMEEESSDGE
jgi:putative DNA primase/helicase